MKSIATKLLAGALLVFGGAAAPTAAQEIGTVGSATQELLGGGAVKRVGARVLRDERIQTDATGRAQLIFLDQTSLTVAPNSDIVLNRYVFDPEAQQGEMGLSIARGAARFVGGRISKNDDVEMRTPTATLGVRGAIVLVDVYPNGDANVFFLFGEALSVATDQGGTATLNRPGQRAEIRPAEEDGLGEVGFASPEELSALYLRFEGPGGAGEGATVTNADLRRAGLDGPGEAILIALIEGVLDPFEPDFDETLDEIIDGGLDLELEEVDEVSRDFFGDLFFP